VAAVSDQMTPEGYEALKTELAELEGPARREIAERIKTAREWGDLKENSEYHDAKNDQAFLETRIARLAARLRNAQVVQPAAGGGAAGVGSHVELRDTRSDKVQGYHLVGAAESDLSQGRLSVESPLGQAVLGRRAGDEIVVRAPRGELHFTVVVVR
jgi:transcription elongation factor GreA